MSGYVVEIPRKLDTDELVEFLSRIYGPNYFDAKTAFLCKAHHEPSFKPGNLILARASNGSLIGVVRIVERRMYVHGAVITVGGISSVAVHHDWRGKGICTALMHRALVNMYERKIAVSVLHARRAMDGFYANYGYVGIGSYADLDVQWPEVGAAAMDWRPVLKQDFSFCRQLYDEQYRHLSGSMVRDRKIWEFQCRHAKAVKFKSRLMVLRKKSKNIGYAVVDGDVVTELSISQEYFPLLAAFFGGKGVKRVAIHPRHPFFLYCRRTFNTTLHDRRPLDGGYMLRVVHPAALLNAVIPHLMRLAEGRFAMVDLFGCRVDLVNGIVSQGKDKVALEGFSSAFTYCVLGARAADECFLESDAQWRVLLGLFPLTGFHTAVADDV